MPGARQLRFSGPPSGNFVRSSPSDTHSAPAIACPRATKTNQYPPPPSFSATLSFSLSLSFFLSSKRELVLSLATLLSSPRILVSPPFVRTPRLLFRDDSAQLSLHHQDLSLLSSVRLPETFHSFRCFSRLRSFPLLGRGGVCFTENDSLSSRVSSLLPASLLFYQSLRHRDKVSLSLSTFLCLLLPGSRTQDSNSCFFLVPCLPFPFLVSSLQLLLLFLTSTSPGQISLIVPGKSSLA